MFYKEFQHFQKFYISISYHSHTTNTTGHLTVLQAVLGERKCFACIHSLIYGKGTKKAATELTILNTSMVNFQGITQSSCITQVLHFPCITGWGVKDDPQNRQPLWHVRCSTSLFHINSPPPSMVPVLCCSSNLKIPDSMNACLTQRRTVNRPM